MKISPPGNVKFCDFSTKITKNSIQYGCKRERERFNFFGPTNTLGQLDLQAGHIGTNHKIYPG